MILAWLLWPIVLVVAVVGKALWRTLQLWKRPVWYGFLAFPGMFVALLILQYIEPDKPANLDNSFQEDQFLLRWWDRWRMLGFARLLPTHGLITYPHYASDKELLYAFLYVSAGASITVAGVVLGLLFVGSLVQTLSTVGKPYRGGIR